MSAESKGVDLQVDGEIITELVAETNQNGKSPAVEDGSGDEEDAPEPTDGDTVTGSSKSKKKKSKKSRLKKALGVPGQDESSSNPASKLTPEMVEQLLEMNPSLGGEVAGMNKEKAAQILKKLDVADLLTGMVRAAAVITFSPAGLLIVGPRLSVGRIRKTWLPINSGKRNLFHDLVSRNPFKASRCELNKMIDETTNVDEGPIKIVDPETVSKEPKPLPENYEWVTMDLTDEKEVPSPTPLRPS